MKINKSKLNLTIDFIMFLVLMAVAGIGFLIKYVLIPGFKRNDVYGKNVELYFNDMDRHQWGSIHLILSFTLLFLLLLHIVFHWKQIVHIFKSIVKSKSWRIIVVCFFIAFSLLFGVMPLFVKPEITEGNAHYFSEHGSINKDLQNSQLIQEPIDEAKVSESIDHPSHSSEHSGIAINGKMTLNEVSETYKISVPELCLGMGIPEEKANERLGRLKKIYGFELNDVRKLIKENE